MERYYYHGIAEYPFCVWMMIEIINSGGLKLRNKVRKFNDERYNHICLYKKNEEHDYTGLENLVKSARGGWIDHCFFFIVSPDISAQKVKYVDRMGTGFDENGNPHTDLVDEWRCGEDIPLDKIVGIGIPFSSIKEDAENYGWFYDMEYRSISPEEYYQVLNKLIEIARSLNWIIVNVHR